MAHITFPYHGEKNNGMPNSNMYNILNKIEEKVDELLLDKDGFLNIGRVTGDNEKVLFLACKDFNKPALVLNKIREAYPKVEMNIDIFKDKYWRSLERFNSKN